jgi:hypothetical protein
LPALVLSHPIANDHFLAARGEGGDDVRADEASAAGYEIHVRLHIRALLNGRNTGA